MPLHGNSLGVGSGQKCWKWFPKVVKTLKCLTYAQDNIHGLRGHCQGIKSHFSQLLREDLVHTCQILPGKQNWQLAYVHITKISKVIQMAWGNLYGIGERPYQELCFSWDVQVISQMFWELSSMALSPATIESFILALLTVMIALNRDP